MKSFIISFMAVMILFLTLQARAEEQNVKNDWKFTIQSGLWLLSRPFSLIYSSIRGPKQNFPVMKYEPSEFYTGEALQAAEAIRDENYSKLATLIKKYPAILRNGGVDSVKRFPLLSWALVHVDEKAFKILIEAGAPADDYSYFTFEMIMGNRDFKYSLLEQAAARLNKNDFFDLLLSHKANPNGVSGTTPPIFSSISGHPEWYCFDQLVTAGADLNVAPHYGETVLTKLIKYSQFERAKNIIELGANINGLDANGDSIRKLVEKAYVSKTDSVLLKAKAQLLEVLKK